MGRTFKAGSAISKVYETLKEKGGEVAFKLGVSLGKKEGTVRNWIRVFAKELGEGLSAEVKAKVAAPPKEKRPINTEGNTIGKTRVFLSYWPELTGVVITAGPQQSVVRWDNGWPQTTYSNEFLIEVKPEKKRKTKAA